MKKWMLVLLAVLVVMLPAWAMAATVDFDTVDYTQEDSFGAGATIDGNLIIIPLHEGDTFTGTVEAGKRIELDYKGCSSDFLNITLENVKLDDGASLYIFDNNDKSCDLTITLIGENELKDGLPAITAGGNLTIQGTGSLTANSTRSSAIDVAGINNLLTIKDSAVVKAKSTDDSYDYSHGIKATGKIVIQESAEVEAESGNSGYGISSGGELTIQDNAKLTANSKNMTGIIADTLTIQDNAMVTVTGYNSGIIVTNDMTVQEKAEVTAKSTVSGNSIYVSRGDLTITGSAKVTARGGKNGDGIVCQNGQMTIKTTGDGYVKAYGGDADTTVQFSKNGYGLSAGNAITLSGNVTAKSGDNENGTMAEGIRSNHGTITILPGSRIEATGNNQRGILSFESITIQYNKPEDLFVKTGLTKENAVEKTNWNALGSTQTNVTFEQEEVYVLIDTTEKALPPAPPVPPVPSADASGSLPKTGDSANLALWAVLMAASAACAVMVSRKLRKQH